MRPNSSSAYHKVERRAGDWAVASAGAAVTMNGDVIADGDDVRLLQTEIDRVPDEV